MKSPIKVAITTDGIYPHAMGGIQKHSAELIKILSEYENLQLHIVHPHTGTRVFSQENIKEYAIEGIDEKKIYAGQCYEYSARVAEVLDEIEPDIIYAKGLTLWKGIKRFKVPKVVNPHGLNPFQPLPYMDKLKSLPLKYGLKTIFKHADIICSEGGELTGILRNIVPEKKIRFLPNAVYLKDFSFSLDDKIRVLFVSRFVPKKGIKNILQAARTFQEENIEFHLAGSGPILEEVKKTEYSENITLHGHVTDEELHQLYRSSHLFLYPSLTEGMPTAILEAMSYGLPVIASDVGAISELVDDQNGKLIKGGDTDELINSLRWFIDRSDEGKQKLAMASHNRIRDGFTWEKIGEKHWELFCFLSEEYPR